MDAQGRSAVHTGRHCFPWAGSVEDQDLVCLGNVLAGPEVVEAMAERYSNPDVDRLIDEAAVLTDRAKTQQAYWRIQKLLMDDVAMIPIYYAVNLYVKSKKVQNFRVHPLELLDLSETTIEE